MTTLCCIKAVTKHLLITEGVCWLCDPSDHFPSFLIHQLFFSIISVSSNFLLQSLMLVLVFHYFVLLTLLKALYGSIMIGVWVFLEPVMFRVILMQSLVFCSHHQVIL